MAKPLDVDAYLARVNYTGPRTADYNTLSSILRSHIASIPFESFDVLLGRPIRLDPEALQAKIVANRRGGYCFEHGSLTRRSKPSASPRSGTPPASCCSNSATKAYASTCFSQSPSTASLM